MPEGGPEGLSPPPKGFEELGAKNGFPPVELSGDAPIAKGAVTPVLLGPRRSRRSELVLVVEASAAFFFFSCCALFCLVWLLVPVRVLGR